MGGVDGSGNVGKDIFPTPLCLDSTHRSDVRVLRHSCRTCDDSPQPAEAHRPEGLDCREANPLLIKVAGFWVPTFNGTMNALIMFVD